MAIRTYGELKYIGKEKDEWHIENAEPHICIKLKAIFAKLPKTGNSFIFKNTPENCQDLLWFIQRYPLSLNKSDLNILESGKEIRISYINDLERILMPNYKPSKSINVLKDGKQGRDYQLIFNEVFLKCKRILNADDIGLGKTIEAILGMNSDTLPCMVVVQTHMPRQWEEKIFEFTNLITHVINKTKPYNLPTADIYIFKYSQLAGWVDIFRTNFFKMVIYDEIQELRHNKTDKYKGGKVASNSAEYCMGLSASPIYNYGNEIYNIMDVIKEGCLGNPYDFYREWMQGFEMKKVKDPAALGTYLRENFLMLRRTRKEVGKELPPINTIVHTVSHDSAEVEKAENIARQLAIKTTTGSFIERGQAAYELDIFVRHYTGVSKARGVAEYVKILLDNNEPIILAGWHRDVYDIWLEELAEYKPVMYTGSESATQKEKAKNAFINGETNLFIISLRSGVGLDGLQNRCKTVVKGELDWSPKVHDQLIGRIDRDRTDDVMEQVTAIYLVSEAGSDPLIIDMLGIKASQSHGIMNPLESAGQQYTDESRIKLLAKKYLDKKLTT